MTSNKWTEEELAQLYDTTLTCVELAATIDRTPNAIRLKRVDMGIIKRNLRYWSADEVALASDLSISNDELSGLLGRSVMSVDKKRRNMGLGLGRDGAWSEDEDDMLLKHYRKIPHSVEWLSWKLKRSRQAIYSRIKRLKQTPRGTIPEPPDLESGALPIAPEV